jgi:arginine N-succinyltransferase
MILAPRLFNQDTHSQHWHPFNRGFDVFRIREAKLNDLDELWSLIGQASIGMTSLQIDKDTLRDRLEKSVFAFSKSIAKAEGAPYVLVLEDLASHALVGTSCIFSKTGGYEPVYAYKIESTKAVSELLQLETLVHSLHLVTEHNGPTEIGSLFLVPDYRGKGCGRLLSLSRFLYMAAHPKRFASTTIAEMRGYQDDQGISPFWEAIGSHFFKVDFPRADSLSMIDKKFIRDLMPRYPIYLELLPHDAVEAIGQVHVQTKPALAMLEAEGFRRNALIDIFDGGPVVECETAKIRAVANSKIVNWQHSESPGDRKALVARVERPFMVMEAKVGFDTNDPEGSVHLSSNAAELLALSPEEKTVVLILD